MEPRSEKIQFFTQVNIAVITRWLAFYAAPVENYLRNEFLPYQEQKVVILGRMQKLSTNMFAK